MIAHRFQMVKSFDINDRLERIRVPALIMAGTKDVLVSPSTLNELVDGLNGARLQDLGPCGHLAFVTHPQLVARKIQEFLEN